MLLGDADIYQALEDEDLFISPFNSAQVQPASYDVRLGDSFHDIRRSESEQDLSLGIWLKPQEFVLGTTLEEVQLSPRIAAQVGGKSSLGRMGLQVHATAGFIDPGFNGQITLEFYNLSQVEIKLMPGMPIAQLTFSWLKTPAQNPYNGRYQDQKGVVASRYYQDK